MNAARPPKLADPVEAASLWLVRHGSGLTDPERAEFAHWLAASPAHAAAWRDVSATDEAFAETRRAGTAAALVVILAARRRRARLRVILGSAGAVSLAAAAALVLLFYPAAPSAPPPVPTPKITARPSAPVAPLAVAPLAPAAPASAVLIHPEERVLEDGSRITLNAGAEIAVDYTPATRAVRLLRGEAVFTVAKNPARPFVVTSGTLRVRAVGTEFAVQNGASATEVLVTEGTVAVERPATSALAPAVPVLLSVGGRLNVDSAAPAGSLPAAETVSADELSRRLAWREPRLHLSGTPLREAVALLNRRNAVQLEVDAAAGDLRLSGYFRADHAEGFARLLANHFGLEIERRSDGVIVVRTPGGPSSR